MLCNLNDCLQLSHSELDLVILANIQAFTRTDIVGEKKKAQCTMQVSFPEPPDLQGDVLKSLFAISQIERTL